MLLAGVLLVALGPVSVPIAPSRWSNAAVHPTFNDSEIDLAVDPPSFWMRSGANVTLGAIWSAGPPLCELTPLWYHWSVTPGNASGFLNDSTGATVTFTADSFDSGPVIVRAQSGALLDCGENETFVERAATAHLSVVTAVSLLDLELTPDPLLPDESATLRGTVVGGEPAYSLAVNWGDGTHSSIELNASGGFAVVHQFPAGEFVPSVSVADPQGEVANATVAETVSVGNGLEVGVLPAAPVAEVGIPTQFTGFVEGASAGLVILDDCSNTTAVPDGSPLPNEADFSCTFSSPGTAEVLFGAYPLRPGEPSASVVLYEPVVGPPRVSSECVGAIGEANGTASLRVDVTGGALPIALSWNLSGNRSAGEETLWSDGTGVIPLPLSVAGEYGVGTRAIDALGSVAANATPTVEVEAALESNASAASTLDSFGAIADVRGDALSGCAPFSWWAVPDFLSSNQSSENGTLATEGDFAWTGSYALEGNLSLTVGVVDGCGVLWQTQLEVPLVPPFGAEMMAEPGPSSFNDTFALNLSIRGGLPPFLLRVNASDNESWNRTVPSDGAYGWRFTTPANGSLALGVSVTDHLGAFIDGNLWVNLTRTSDPPTPPAPSPPPAAAPPPATNLTTTASPDGSWALAFLLVPVGVVAIALLWRRRRASETSKVVPEPDPVTTLQRIIEPADGAERFTVELLAEEAGIPLAVVRSTIDRLVGEGKVRSESGADGEEVLSWSPESGR